MTEYETNYQAIGTFEDDLDAPPDENIVHVVPDNGRARWNHIVDLDEFFTRVYQYHQRNGFLCMLLQDVLQLVQFMFVVLFSTFLIECVNYEVLFDENSNSTFTMHHDKVTIAEAVYSLEECVQGFGTVIVICLLVSALFWLFRFIKIIYNLFKYLEMRAFYTQALKISSKELSSLTWHEVQHKLLEVQKDQQMCIHKNELTELDIYHRILRFKNYTVAMVNKSLLPVRYRIPFYGEYVFLTTGLKYNMEMILFWGPWSPFENNWHLKADFKNHHKRQELGAYLSRRILWVGIANLLLSPLIFLWQIFYSFFRYAEILKREPSALGSRMWSLNARLFLRHFNELDHEFNARLNRGYRPSEKYMNIFTSPVLVIMAKHLAFFAGAMLAVLLILTVIDEDVLAVQHMIAVMTCLGIIVTVCRGCIPDEHMVWCPELLMRTILGQIHYIPDNWQGNAHTTRVRDGFAQLFQYKLVYLLEELLSPLLTPLILLLKMRKQSLEIVDFYRNFTVEVTGVGDVCSFAQMNIRRHGNPQWVTNQQTDSHLSQQAELGKTELSLMHFTLTNPEWRPPAIENQFLARLKDQAQRDATSLSLMPADNPLLSSLHSLSSGGGYFGFNSMISSLVPAPGQHPHPLVAPGDQPLGPTPINYEVPTPTTGGATRNHCRGGLRNMEGPLGGSTTGLLASLQQPPLGGAAPYASLSPTTGPPGVESRGRMYDEQQLELLSAEMSFSALYLHELHRRRMFQPLFDIVHDPVPPPPPGEATELQDPTWPAGGGAVASLPHIRENTEEEEEEENNEHLPLITSAQPQPPWHR